MSRLFCLFLGVFLIPFVSAQLQDRALCYSGSTLYQQVVQNCNDEDPDYTGRWYCSTVVMCEPYMRSKRECVATRGCAKEEQCTNANGEIMDGEELTLATGSLPAGVSLKTYCCSAHDFPDDDAIAIDYSDICNSAGRISSSMVMITTFVLLATILISLF